MMNCPSIRYIVPVKISFALSLCQKNWFCGKVCLDDFYLLLCSKSSSWIHIGVKKNPQACCLDHLKKYGKNVKTQLWDEKQNRVLFLDHPVLKKIEFRGLSEETTKWFKSFSEPGNLLCTVPQGSIFGPLLFFLYINDMPQAVDCELLLYADETCLVFQHLIHVINKI